MASPFALPAVLEEIAQVAGLDAAWALARARGGTTIFLPRKPGKRHWLSDIVGHEAATKICAHFRGNHTMSITVPMAARQQSAELWREALQRGPDGQYLRSINETALHMGVHKDTVSKRRHKARVSGDNDDGPQGDLFAARSRKL